MITNASGVVTDGLGKTAKRGYIGFDLETTGLNPEKDRIVEFAFIELDRDLNEVRRWTERVNPTIPIPPEVVEIHGISNDDVAKCATFAAHAKRAQALLDEYVPIGYNVDYDIEVLHHELVRAGQPGIPVDSPRVDPYAAYREFIPDLYKLTGAVRQYLGREHDGAHGAEADVAATVEILRSQISRHEPLQNRVRAALDPPATPGKKWLDRRRVFYQHDDGSVRFAINPSMDQPVSANIGFLDWIIRKDFPEETKAVAALLRQTGGRPLTAR